MNYAAAYAQTNNEYKEKSVVSRTNHGNTNMYNAKINVSYAIIAPDKNNNRH